MSKRDIIGAVDFEHLERYSGGDQALVDEVLTLFREQTAVWLRLLDPAAKDGAWRDAAHSLKGSALGVGAFDLAKACETAEVEAHTDDGRRAVLLNHVRDAVNAALSDIAAYEHEQALKSLRGKGGG